MKLVFHQSEAPHCAAEFMLRCCFTSRESGAADDGRIQPYLTAVGCPFRTEVDFGTLTKTYGAEAEGARHYSPPVCIGCIAPTVSGDPNPAGAKPRATTSVPA